MPSETCPVCSKPLVEGADFCPFCGNQRIPSDTSAAIDSYIQSQLNLELSKRLKDQQSVVREIADQAEDVVWTRIKRYTVLVALLPTVILGAIAFFGITTVNDVSKRIEPIIRDAENRAKAAKTTIEETASQVDAVKASLDRLSSDVDAQTKRVAEKNSEMSQKLAALDAAASEAQKKGETYQAHSEELSARLDAMEKALETKVEQISNQVDDISIRRTYPNLGEKLFVTLDGSRWKGKSAKGSNEKWVSIWVGANAISDFYPSQFEQLMSELKAHNYTPILGMFGVGGPYSSGVGSFEGSAETATVFYFNKDSEQLATTVCAIASKTLSVNGCKPQFVDQNSFPKDDIRKLIIEQSGLDCQLALNPRSK